MLSRSMELFECVAAISLSKVLNWHQSSPLSISFLCQEKYLPLGDSITAKSRTFAEQSTSSW
ncbi:hypothetical protein POREN0001_1934 [Porphyromonas endodontalis ATCC 35406]|uniref:Uncharacterized protein n=1 Tax=Porphyromonas endodontalis (strain ATCC 35406 / DSM 24491 / JCM 8526 / CCUG 16442 / BCRC 14492 / NCTC 13058 / HG 370) TaxID=553175 RepID=C3JCR6_POREA|nr:hypothetical protein POREN0001_1934 [Porphyromonas endodontalis ATCC 35406]